jgi:hypothetical protein
VFAEFDRISADFLQPQNFCRFSAARKFLPTQKICRKFTSFFRNSVIAENLQKFYQILQIHKSYPILQTQKFYPILQTQKFFKILFILKPLTPQIKSNLFKDKNLIFGF